MNCRDAQELIPLHVGDDLPVADAEALEGHLENCALCEADYGRYAQAREDLLLLRDEEAPTAPPLWASVADGLLERPTAAEPPTPTSRRGALLRALWRGGLAAALLVGVTAPIWLPEADPMQPAEGGELAAGEDNGPRVQPVSPEELRDFLHRTGTLPTPSEGVDETVLMAPASNRGQM